MTQTKVISAAAWLTGLVLASGVWRASICVAAGSSAAASGLYVRGWELPDLQLPTPPLSYGDDPVFGRQICPALTRLSLAQKRSEDLLLRRVAVERQGEGTVWRYALRPGLFWWGGQAVATKDLANFLQEQLPAIAKERGLGLWQVPDFKATVSGDEVSLHFTSEPTFGPYVVNGAPFFRPGRPGAGLHYECVGLYKPQAEGSGIVLTAAPGYKARRALPTLHLVKDGTPVSALVARQTLSFVYASAAPALPAARPADVSMSCARSLELPEATMIVWNTQAGLTAKQDFRRAVGHLIPRAALVNAGAAGLAEPASSPVPRQHPGFNAFLAPKPFDLRTASDLLNHLGYRRQTAVSPRIDDKGEPLQLVLLSQSASSGLVEKVLTDAFSAVGINVDFKRSVPAGDVADGVLAGFALDWPRVSFLGNFHTGVAAKPPFAPLGDQALDRLLERYALSLTTATPDFTILAAIQKHLADVEPMTVLFQQKACLEVGSSLKLAKGSVSPKDPDWFRQLLL